MERGSDVYVDGLCVQKAGNPGLQTNKEWNGMLHSPDFSGPKIRRSIEGHANMDFLAELPSAQNSEFRWIIPSLAS